MRVSFVIPTRNQAGFIRRCLDGCLAQRLPDAEVIVVDGRSTDGTLDVLGSYGNRIRWVSEPDAGQADAINKGVSMARGELIAWINSDDYYASARVLPTVIALFEADGELDLVHGDGLMVDVRGAPIRPIRGRAVVSARQLVRWPTPRLPQPAVFFRRTLFHRVGGLAVDLHYAMDYDLWIRMWDRAGRIAYVPETLACSTYHRDAKSIRGMRRHIRECVVLKLRHGRRLGLTTLEWAGTVAGILCLYAYWGAVTLGLRRTL